MPFSFRLDPATEAKIRRLARQSGRSRSAIVREAMAAYDAGPDAPQRAPSAPTALDRLRPFIGVVATSHQLSSDTHRKFREALERKQRERRSR